jgi:hypothetical protein
MPFLGLVVFAIQISLAIHAARRGRAWPWCYIILIIPVLGSLAYVFAEVLPEWSGTYQGQRAKARLGRAINPEKNYRALKNELEIADTIANRSALAEECLALGRFDEAKAQYDAILAMPIGDEPGYMLGRARAEFGLAQSGLAQYAEVLATLDELRQRWPAYQSGDGHLIYARALEAEGRLAEAVEEYRALSNYYAGAEPRVRLGLALRKLGREAEARTVLTDVVRQMRLAPKFARKAQAEWISMAEAALR